MATFVLTLQILALLTGVRGDEGTSEAETAGKRKYQLNWRHSASTCVLERENVTIVTELLYWRCYTRESINFGRSMEFCHQMQTLHCCSSADKWLTEAQILGHRFLCFKMGITSLILKNLFNSPTALLTAVAFGCYPRSLDFLLRLPRSSWWNTLPACCCFCILVLTPAFSASSWEASTWESRAAPGFYF